jgi:TetR/AcrR family fatty acid metabolism transcriptional regulator
VRTKTLAQAEKILAAAARLFATQRFHEARMEDIAAAAEVGKGTLYRYFKDKDELYDALLVRAGEQLSRRLAEVMERVGGARARLEAIIAAVVGYFDEQPHLFDLIHRAEVMHAAGGDFPWEGTRQENIRLVRRVFAEGAESGEFTVRDPELGGLMLLGGIRAVIRFGRRPRAPDLARRIVDDFLAGACRPGPARPPGNERLRTAQPAQA